MKQQATTLFINSAVITIDDTDRICEAAAVRGNRILFVGSASEAIRRAGSQTDVVDLRGRCLVPGFVDAHCHAATYGVAKQQLPCSPRDVSSIDELLKSVATMAESTPPGEWILGRGYNHLSMREKRHPTPVGTGFSGTSTIKFFSFEPVGIWLWPTAGCWRIRYRPGNP